MLNGLRQFMRWLIWCARRERRENEQIGTYWYVDENNGSDDNTGLAPDAALATRQAAIDRVDAPRCDVVIMLPGAPNEGIREGDEGVGFRVTHKGPEWYGTTSEIVPLDDD